MWTLGFLLVDSKHKTFEEAFRTMYIKMGNEPMDIQLLETAIWIVSPDKEFYDFYKAKDKAYNDGLLKDGILT
jgi:hypothetical protein